MNVCQVTGCVDRVRGLGYCDKHYQRVRRTGSIAVAAYVEMTEEARFWSNVDLTGSCWTWTAGVNNNGYGVFATWIGGRKKYLANRYALRVLGLLNESLVVLHACDNPRCVNPEHLGQGTQEDNMRDAARKGRIVNQFGPQKNVDGLTKAERAA